MKRVFIDIESVGKKSIKECWEEERWGYKELEGFMRQFIHVLYELGNYLLDVNRLSLNVNHIYREGNQYVFCYLPGETKNIWREFHVLMENIVKEMDDADKEGIYLAYELHKASMEEDYDIEQMLEQILERKEQEMQRILPKKREMVYDVEEEMLLSDWAGVQELTGKTVRDHQTVWGFVNNRIHKRNRAGWNEIESNPTS